ncbi:hypothetical protein HYALB_00007539 [Hymenoscyphus albidus]|uniref:Major facilitator superfamily (MFS) profile domain-containing protein n=1 Tax=Hymenoscyphus albidus TaxID=595503 RepID=A0A9N9LP20_9HELO|nr:hypothetical protein HYALB_00007539 [Hymenoscyphus albidus]
MAFFKYITWVYRELGLNSLYSTGVDAWLIITARCLRMVAFGTVSLILALFFSALKFSDTYIGLFMTLTLLGDVVLSVGITLIADQVGRRRVLIGGSTLMVVSGLMFSYFDNYWILLCAAVLGVISPNGADFGPFRAIEESMLSTLTGPKTRPDVLSWYITAATLGQSVGTEASGRFVEYLDKLEGWVITDAYHAVFWIYSVVGMLNILCMVLLGDKCEAPVAPTEHQEEDAEGLLEGEEGRELEERESRSLENVQPSKVETPPEKKSFFTHISRDTRVAMYKLWFLLIIDSLADGMVGYSLVTYYMDLKFHLPKSTLGDITSSSYFLSFISTLFAAPLSRRLGLVNTMVFTHLPSSAAVLFFPLPKSIVLTVILLMIRTGLNSMDQAPRVAFIAAVVRPEERTAIMGITSMLRTLASAIGPTVTGILAGHDRFWIAFVAAGALRITYDLGLYAMFVNVKLHQHEGGEKNASLPVDDERRSSDEEVR